MVPASLVAGQVLADGSGSGTRGSASFIHLTAARRRTGRVSTSTLSTHCSIDHACGESAHLLVGNRLEEGLDDTGADPRKGRS